MSVSVSIKPYHGSSSDGWEWDGKILKPYHGSSSDGWELDGWALKPYHGSSSDGWETDGDVPVPVLALICIKLKRPR